MSSDALTLLFARQKVLEVVFLNIVLQTSIPFGMELIALQVQSPFLHLPFNQFPPHSPTYPIILTFSVDSYPIVLSRCG